MEFEQNTSMETRSNTELIDHWQGIVHVVRNGNLIEFGRKFRWWEKLKEQPL